MIFFLCTTPRSGNHLLISLLNSTGATGRIHLVSMLRDYRWTELTDFPYKDRYEAPDEVIQDVFQQHLDKHQSASDIFGAKIYPRDTPIVKRYLEINGTDAKWIYLYRQNIIRQAISYYKAQRNGQWNSAERKVNRDELPVDLAKIIEIVMMFYFLGKEWDIFFQDNNIIPHTVLYEDLIHEANWNALIEQILTYLGVDYTTLRLSPSSPYERQSNEWNEKIYSIFISAYKGSSYGLPDYESLLRQ